MPVDKPSANIKHTHCSGDAHLGAIIGKEGSVSLLTEKCRRSAYALPPVADSPV
jgi:hypothetical protein